MNRKTKGALAAGAGAILLLGGAGSLAFWSDSDDYSGDSIDTGHLSLECDATSGWVDVSADVPGNPSPVAAGDTMVPGDTWRYGGTCTPSLDGKNMRAVFEVTQSSTPLSPNFTVGSTVNGAPVPSTGFVATDGTPVDVGITVTFDWNTPNNGTGVAADNQDMDSTVTVSDLSILLKQVRPS